MVRSSLTTAPIRRAVAATALARLLEGGRASQRTPGAGNLSSPSASKQAPAMARRRYVNITGQRTVAGVLGCKTADLLAGVEAVPPTAVGWSSSGESRLMAESNVGERLCAFT